MFDPQDYDAFDPADGWVNYGDVNPDEHGGRFVKWDADAEKFIVVETVPMMEIAPASEDASPTAHHVEVLDVYPDNIWEGGDPEAGFTREMDDITESLHERGGLSGDSPEPDGDRFMGDVAYYVANMTHYLHGRAHTVDASDYDGYDDMVADYGVENYE